MSAATAAIADIPGVRHLGSGKVRELYEVDGKLLLVASDRISAYDYVLESPIPDKGKILTQLSLWWFGQLTDLVPNHLVTTDPAMFPVELRDHKDLLSGRSMLCERLSMIEIECVARGYLTGSGLSEYDERGTACGIALPPGLVDGSRLAEPIFTPAAKAAVGEHDENIDFAETVRRVGSDLANEIRELTIAIYRRAHEIAAGRGIILADTKFEFGQRADGTVVLADEVLTPDSSRFWPADLWEPGHPQPSYDKQYVRDWLTGPESGWDRKSGEFPPPLPEDVVERTRARYVEAYEKLTGSKFE
ncbi:phosphoribosylaminoimidazolesuccinocarboxamide synthase [Actinospica sp.]|uniref:phosphoribosylaminoimidazolesuccinocarboxamide synthase n=1 Tax=Actinospica sp. TaxID=1872142 RepID=UPI002C6459BF|nr:phosphoribosylaminoimidazolesuccinocarboxamide synthase [Actinospica sp.]HWG22725.1 phosphoribosylaminoimidazolesuccinocarboxamide synthase [Actinospica sp.]